jgi:1-deoxy-D-xylulose-5-phosphate reductoisomerase
MAEIRKICILGSTGSIGRNSLEVIAALPDRFRVTGLAANTSIDLLSDQIRRFHPDFVAVRDPLAAAELKKRVNGAPEILVGDEGIRELARHESSDIVISSFVGFAGLRPTVDALMKGKTIALANKETLVVAGQLILPLAKKYHATILPVDSEHSAILQCLAGEHRSHIARLILTASGGPFLKLGAKEFSRVTIQQALAHPNWKMGNKITIDSATLMNKGLEVIEARWLFDLPPESIEVLVHPQSIIHSMVEFVDGSIKAQLGIPDMKLPIQYALTYPERTTSPAPKIDFTALREMTFCAPDMEKFECLRLAYEALCTGGTAPTIMNAANEIAVGLFLSGTIGFDAIPKIIRHALEKIPAVSSPSLDDIFETDRRTREQLSSIETIFKRS